MNMDNLSEENLNHYYHKWLYQYGGASDVVTLREYIEDYDSKIYGDVDKYDTTLCPCVMCMENINDQQITEEMV
jgi:hypothetical protein